MDVDENDLDDELPDPRTRMPPDHPLSMQNTASSSFTAGGGRRLGDDSSAPIPSTSVPMSAPTAKPKKATKAKSKITGFRDIRDRETEEEDDDDEPKDQEFYAGGDKSGLAVQEPGSGGQGHNDQVRRLLETARR